jgi:type I restriction enzyme, S subunit
MNEPLSIQPGSGVRHFKRYARYNTSGSTWIGMLPTHWRVLPLRRVVERFVDYRGKTPEKVPSGVRLITAANIKNGRIDFSESEDFIAEDAYGNWMIRGLPERGDVLVTTEAPLGEAAQIEDPNVALAQRIILLKTVPGSIANTYLKFHFGADSGRSELITRSTGSTAIGIKASHFKATLVTVPPLSEQHAVADFLLRETTKIDALMAKKERLIELLQEKRTAIITQAVTKGLNPNAPMKASGIEWLGDIPQHWDTNRNKVIFREFDSRSAAGEEELLTVSHITGVTRRSEKNVTMIEPESHAGYKLCSAGDLIINTMWAWMGALGIAREAGMVSPNYNVYRPTNSALFPRYYDYLCRTPANVTEIIRYSNGVWRSRLRLYPHDFFQIHTPLPPGAEQQAIAHFLDVQTHEIDKLIAKIRVGIERLKEYRIALISSAVTGKIDVRDEINNRVEASASDADS